MGGRYADSDERAGKMAKTLSILAVYLLSPLIATVQSSEERSDWDRAMEKCAAIKLLPGCNCVPRFDDGWGPMTEIVCEDDEEMQDDD